VTGADAGAVLELSLREATQLGQDHIGAEHILLGLVREGDGVAAQVLVKLGADLNRVRQQVIQLVQGRAGEDVTGAGSGLGKRARAQLPDVTLTRASSLDRRVAAIELWVGMRPDLDQLDQEIAQVRREKEAAIDRQDFEASAALRDQERQLLAARAAREKGVDRGRCWPHDAGPGIGPGERRAGEAAGHFATTVSNRVTTLHSRPRDWAFVAGHEARRLCAAPRLYSV
jgi:ATP-dependent Clp protease ATP-binding subunit ClpA